MNDATHTKSSLRHALRARRRTIPAAVQRERARTVAERAMTLPRWPGATAIGLYQAADGEVSTEAIAEQCRAQGKQIHLPVVKADRQLVFAPLHQDTVLRHNRYGIAEPAVDTGAVRAEILDILFMPLVGWDRQGNRLGMGAGFYDRALASGRRPFLVGLAHALQEVPALPRDPWDIPLQAVITESETVLFQGR